MTTTEFIGAAHAQCTALGLPDYEPILVAHPIQPKTQAEVRALADQVIDQIIAKLLRDRQRQAA